MSFLANLSWRYATKKFDQNRQVSAADLNKILEAVRLAPTSFGLQAFHLTVVENRPGNEEKLQALKTASWDQNQIDSCSHLLVFSARTDSAVVVDEHFTRLSGGDLEKRRQFAAYEERVTSSLPNLNLEWAKKQTYILLGFALAAAAELQIDSCPMEGFDHDKFQEILALPKNLSVSVILPIGYRLPDETIRPKHRLPKEKLISVI